jgi:NADH-quinone oxidoreductase subunit A
LTLGLLQPEISYGTLYLYVGIFMLLISGFVATVLVLARLISPSRRSSTKAQNYETGEITVTDPWRPFPVRYYVFALLFLIFDVEAAFLYPWAVIYRELGVYWALASSTPGRRGPSSGCDAAVQRTEHSDDELGQAL